SSHTVPTPRGGGVAIVLVFLLGSLGLWRFDLMPTNHFIALFGAGALIAVIGFIDDHQHIPARWRLLGHFIGAAWGLYFVPLPFSMNLVWLLYVVAAFYLVWLLNLYNFMDGIDGIASIEAISVCLGAVLLQGVTQSAPLLLLMGAVAGFLAWNYPPAKIFMGDAGSGFLGIALGLFSLQSATIELFICWLILLGVFIVDATWTLIHRFLQGEKVYEAHRSHAYQYASRFYGSHKKVSLSVATINTIWLLPIALAVSLSHLNAVLGLLIAYMPLVVLAIKFNAGLKE
ncbi:partial Fuc2NAc and GlcNAc transferase, partial [Anaerolineae bacterium]